jgi:hypothetical protein
MGVGFRATIFFATFFFLGWGEVESELRSKRADVLVCCSPDATFPCCSPDATLPTPVEACGFNFLGEVLEGDSFDGVFVIVRIEETTVESISSYVYAVPSPSSFVLPNQTTILVLKETTAVASIPSKG